MNLDIKTVVNFAKKLREFRLATDIELGGNRPFDKIVCHKDSFDKTIACAKECLYINELPNFFRFTYQFDDILPKSIALLYKDDAIVDCLLLDEGRLAINSDTNIDEI